MDTSVTDVADSPFRGVLGDLRKGDRPLTLVLLRIENNGATDIDESDYVAPKDKHVGIRIEFARREVVGMVITELSDEDLDDHFDNGSGLKYDGNTIQLPKVPLDRRQHYKVLAALEGTDTIKEPFPPPHVSGGIRGGVGTRGVQETRSRTGTPKRTIALVGLLAAIVIAQLVIFVQSNRGAPLDCATGNLALTGSTAFEPIVREAAKSYRDACPDAAFSFDMRGSGEGLQAVDRLGREGKATGMLALSDGEKPDGMPGLVPRPIAFFLFTLVINSDTGVHDLSADQVKRIYRGEVASWKDIGGNDVPIRLVSRNPGSGTRAAFQRRVLGGQREPGTNSDDCRDRDPGSPAGVVRCARNSTDDVLRTVADTPGALGYSELGAAEDRDDLSVVRIGGHPATVAEADHGTYPFWETEFGYTYGEPAAESLAASFLRYLTNQVGADIIRSHGDRSCAELANPQLCRPT